MSFKVVTPIIQKLIFWFFHIPINTQHFLSMLSFVDKPLRWKHLKIKNSIIDFFIFSFSNNSKNHFLIFSYSNKYPTFSGEWVGLETLLIVHYVPCLFSRSLVMYLTHCLGQSVVYPTYSLRLSVMYPAHCLAVPPT